MRNNSKIIEEIVELSAIRSAYNHYLGSWRGLTEVENTTRITGNLKIVSSSINLLHYQLEKERQVKTAEKRQPARAATVFHSAAEQNAIVHFNRDKRFKITE